MNKQKLIKLRCKAWGITEDEYYCNQCSDFSLEDMARAYRRGKNKGFEKVKELEAQIEKIKSDVIKSFGDEYNVLVAKLLKEWEIKEND